MYRRLVNNEEYKECLSLDNLKKNVKKKPVRIVEFSDSDEDIEDVEEKVENVIENKVENVVIDEEDEDLF